MQTYYDIELGEDDFAIATSTGPEKFSAPIVLKKYVVVNNREAAHLTKLLIDDHSCSLVLMQELTSPYRTSGCSIATR